MSSYLLYFPGQTGADPRHFERAGLGELLRTDDLQPSFADVVDRGPDGGAGVIAGWIDVRHPAANPRMGHFPEAQTWEPCKPDASRKLPAGRFWLGREAARPPGPEQLARDVQLAGFEHLLADGNLWLAPNILLLPHRYALGEDDQEIRVVKASHASIFERGLWCYRAIEAEVRENAPRPGKLLREYCAEMLALNYRVNREISYWLGLWDDDDETWWQFALKTVDWLALQAIENDVKKKAGQPTPPG